MANNSDIRKTDYRDIMRNYSNVFELYSDNQQRTAMLENEKAELQSRLENAGSGGDQSDELQAKLNDALDKTADLEEELEKLSKKCKKLESENEKLKEGSSGEEPSSYARERLRRVRGKTTSDRDLVAERIALSQEFADGMAELEEPLFMAIKNKDSDRPELIPDVNYRQVPLICYGDMVTLNPFFYSALENGEESYASLIEAEGAFQINEMNSTQSVYGLEAICPAEMEKEGDRYFIKLKGDMTMRKKF